LRGDDAQANVLIGDILSAGFYGVASLVVWQVSRRCAEMPRARSAWRLIAIGLFFYCGAGYGRTRAELIDAADRAMYTAKRFGRNQAVAAARSAVDPASGRPVDVRRVPATSVVG